MLKTFLSPCFKTLPPLIQIVKGRVPLQAWVGCWLDPPKRCGICLLGLLAHVAANLVTVETFLRKLLALFGVLGHSSHGPSLIWELGSSYRLHLIFAEFVLGSTIKKKKKKTYHTLSNQIKSSLDIFLKKSDSCIHFPQLKKRSWWKCQIWNWTQFCKEIVHFFLDKR